MPRKVTTKRTADNTDTEADPPATSAKRGRKKVKVESTDELATTTTPSTRRTARKALEEKSDSGEDPIKSSKQSPDKLQINSVKSRVVVEKKRTAKSAKGKADLSEDEVNEEDDEAADEQKIKKKHKTKEEKETENMPLAARTTIGSLKHAMYIGAHVSASGGVQNSISNSLHIGGNAFALFLKNQKRWTSAPLAPEARDQFKASCTEHKYDATKHILPHGSYLVNLAQEDAEKAQQAYSCFLEDLQRCEALGIVLYNFHPGNTGGKPRPEAIARIAAQLNKAHKATKTVVTVLENMAGAGNVIGSTWEDLRDIIALIEDKSRVGVCIDTCHTLAAGYDLRSPDAFEKTMSSFSEIVGMSYLKALHLNDSKTPLASKRDLHANIGTGFLGLRAFHNVVNFAPFQGLPMLLETPIEKKGADGKKVEDKSVWAAEIKLLESLVGADTDTKDFQEQEQRLQDVGAEERKKYQGQVEKKQQKTLDSMFKKASPKKKKLKKEETEDSEDEEGGCSH